MSVERPPEECVQDLTGPFPRDPSEMNYAGNNDTKSVHHSSRDQLVPAKHYSMGLTSDECVHSQCDDKCTIMHWGNLATTAADAVITDNIMDHKSLENAAVEVASVVAEECLNPTDSFSPLEEEGKKSCSRNNGRERTESTTGATTSEGVVEEETRLAVGGGMTEDEIGEIGNVEEVKENMDGIEGTDTEGKQEGDGEAGGVVSEGVDQVRQEEESGSATEDMPRRYQLSNDLQLVAEARKDFNSSNYFRGCKWAPDGSCLLTCNDDNRMRLYNLPAQMFSPEKAEMQHDVLELCPALTVVARECIYDYCWYPRMNSWEPPTCCFISTCKDHPIHLWDAFTGRNRASYVPFNHLDEVVSSYSLSFSLDGERIFAGFHKSIRIFDLTRPGRDCRTLSTYVRKTGGQSGIISSIAQCPVVNKLYALGSYSCSVGVYTEDMKDPCMIFTGLASGVTHLLFSPDGNTLYSGFRKCGSIIGWDLRNPGHTLHNMERVVDTNQRIYFDMTSHGDYVVSGSTCGHILGWKTSPREEEEISTSSSFISKPLEPSLHYLAHSDVVNGVSVHPNLPLLASCSGQRHYSLPGNCSDDEEMEESNTASDLSKSSSPNSLKLWTY